MISLKSLKPIANGEVRFGEENGVAFIRRFTNKESYTLYFYKGENIKDFAVKNQIFSRNYQNNKFVKTGFIITKD